MMWRMTGRALGEVSVGTLRVLSGTSSAGKTSIAREVQEAFVGVRCPLEVAQRWELARGDRTLGQGASQIALVHAHGVYDDE